MKKCVPLHPQLRKAIAIDKFGAVVQLVRIPACHAGGRGFESLPHRQRRFSEISLERLFILYRRMFHKNFKLFWILSGGGLYLWQNSKWYEKVYVCGCGKENGDDQNHVICPTDKVTWAALVEEYSFLEGFPVFDGEVENFQYKELMGMKTVTFFDYKCEESVATTYYAKFVTAGFTKSEGSEIYRKTVGELVYIFTGSYSAKDNNFALSFSVDKK